MNDSKNQESSAVSSAGRVVSWRPIETAPKSGIAILIYTDYKKMATAYWSGGTWTDWMRPEHTYGSVIDWQPLPEPPWLVDEAHRETRG